MTDSDLLDIVKEEIKKKLNWRDDSVGDGKTYIATQCGNFKVLLTKDLCNEISACKNVTITGSETVVTSAGSLSAIPQFQYRAICG